MSLVTIRIPNVLQHHTGQQREITARGATVREVLAAMFEEFPTLRESLVPASGDVLEATNLFLNDEDVGAADGLDTPTADNDRLTILPAMAGGAAAHDECD